jgi:hypothetical protein
MEGNAAYFAYGAGGDRCQPAATRPVDSNRQRFVVGHPAIVLAR